jgi:hypothetical protein
MAVHSSLKGLICHWRHTRHCPLLQHLRQSNSDGANWVEVSIPLCCKRAEADTALQVLRRLRGCDNSLRPDGLLLLP